ncbi:MAG TPA: hypothetical protein VMD92_03570 [Acidobacteriaceae bacterium]|jgi:hypothetical protein|nr:hypothetical protein [Acidobacteriaceae bacterium]
MTKSHGLNIPRLMVLAALCGALPVPALLAQSAQSTQPQPQTAPQTQQSQPSQDQYTGVSHPPPDSSIEVDEDLSQSAPAPAAKPSAAIPMAPATPPPAVAAAPAPAASPVPPPPAAAYSAPNSANPEFAGEVDNTDMGIVTVVSAPGAAEPLQTRPASADYGIVSDVPDNPYDLREGTNITVRLAAELSTAETQPGTSFRASVMNDVYSDGKVIIPAGSEMRGSVVSVSQGHHLGPHATIHLRPDVVVLPDGTAYHLYAEVVESDAPGTHANDEGGIEASNHYKKDAIEYGAAVGAGAVTGGAVAGPVGAGVGSLVGAGAVTTHMLLQDPQAANLPAGTLLVFSLTQPMGLTPTKN